MVGSRAVTLSAVFAMIAGCSSSAPVEQAVSTSSPIQGGTDDLKHSFAVGVCVGSPGNCQLICSGALIAPNLVLTARHCVDQSPQQIDCTLPSTKFGAQHAATNFFSITTDGDMSQGTTGWHDAKKIYRTPGNAFCGNDMALIELVDNVSLKEAAGTFVTPVVQYKMTDHTRYASTVTALGYGLLTRRPWGRTLALIAGILTLFKFPLGTALGIYTLVVLASSEAQAEYDSIVYRG